MQQLNSNHPMMKMMRDNMPQFLALIIWKLRKHLPGLLVRITTEDMKELTLAFAFQKPIVACIGEPEAVVFQLVDETTGQALFVGESGSILSPAALEMEEMLKAREEAPRIAQVLAREAAGSQTPELFKEAARALMLLSGPHK